MMRGGTRRRAQAARWFATFVVSMVVAGSAAGVLAPHDSVAQEDATGVSSWDEYADRVDEAYTIALELGGDVSTYRKAHELAASVNRLLPVTERVEVEGEVIEVDNSVLRSEVARLDSADDARRRRRAAEAITAHLASLSRSVDERRALEVPSDPETLEELLAGSDAELQQQLWELVERVVEWIAALLRSGELESDTAAVVAQVITISLLVALGLLLAWIVWRLIRYYLARRREGRPAPKVSTLAEPIVSAAEGLPDDALGHAEGLAARGSYRDAVRALFGGAARTLVETGVVRQTRTLTNAELLREVRPVSAEAHVPLFSLSGTFEASWYGHVDPGAAGFEEARSRYAEVVAAAQRAAARREGEAR